jgi:DNA repair photolyase
LSVRLVQCSSALSKSRLPGLDFALNPYRGCAHGCAYCYAQDVTRFETGVPWGQSIEVKVNIVQKLKKELEKDVEGVIGIGTVTDPYQPVERKFELTRGCLTLLQRHRARASILTKSSMVLRDLDILRSWPEVEVGISISTMDGSITDLIEPGASPPRERMDALSELGRSGVSAYMMLAPVVAGISDTDESLRTLIREASRASVRYVMWDMFNPKPLASARLKERLSSRGGQQAMSGSKESAARVRKSLEEACSAEGLRLVDAF